MIPQQIVVVSLTGARWLSCISLLFSRPPSIKNTRKNLGVRWTNKSQPIDEMAVTIETGGRIFVDPAGNLVVNIVNIHDESAYRYVHGPGDD